MSERKGKRTTVTIGAREVEIPRCLTDKPPTFGDIAQIQALAAIERDITEAEAEAVALSAGELQLYRVTVTATCEQTIRIVAHSASEAEDLARDSEELDVEDGPFDIEVYARRIEL